MGDTVGARSAAEAVRAAVAEAMSQRRIRFDGTTNDNAGSWLNQPSDEVRGLLCQARAHVVAVGERVPAARADRVAVLAQVDRLAAEDGAVTGLLNFVAGLPNTATAAMLGTRLAGNGGADPISPILLPSGGIPASMSTTAAPCEYPPSTIRVDGHCRDQRRDAVGGVGGAVGGGQEVIRGGIVDRVGGEAAAADQRAECVGERLAGPVRGQACRWCRGRRSPRCRGTVRPSPTGAMARVVAAQTRVETIAASRADIRSKVTPVIFTYRAQLRPTVCPIARLRVDRPATSIRPASRCGRPAGPASARRARRRLRWPVSA